MDYTAIFKGFLQIIASSHLRTKRSGIPSKLSKVEKVMRCTITMIWSINPNIPKQSNIRFKLNWRYPTMIMNPAYHHGPRIFFMILNGNIVMDEDVPKTLSETLLWDVQRKKSTTPPVFWGLVLGRWDWKWLEKMMELKMLHWGMLEWLFWRVTIRILTKTSKCPLPPRHLHTPTSSRFLFLPVTWKTSWEKVHETNRTQWKLCYRTPSFLWLKTVLCDIPLYLLWLGTQNPNRWYLAMVDGNVDPTFIWEYGVYIHS